MAHRTEMRIRPIKGPQGTVYQRCVLLTTHDRWAMVRVKGRSDPFVISLATWDSFREATDEERRTPNEFVKAEQ